MSIPVNAFDPASPRRNLLKSYGQILPEMITAYDMTCLFAPNRNAQDNVQLFECIMNSINEKAQKKMALREKE